MVEGAFREIGRNALLGPPIPADHTAPLEVITNPRAWTVLYPESAIGMPPAGVRVVSEARNRLRVPMRAVLRSGAERGLGLRDLLTALRP